MQDKNFLDSSVFVWGMAILIVFSIVTYSIETLPTLKPEIRTFLHYAETVVITIFTIEYLFRIALSKQKLKFVFSFYGIIDLVAILPFYLATTIDLRSVRILRLLRLARVLKLVRYNRAIGRFSKALALAKEELILFTLATLALLFLAAVGIYHFENRVQPEVFSSIFDCLWWAVASLTTVGYGDIYPVTTGGRIFTFFVLMLGLGMVAVPTGIVSSALSEIRINEATQKDDPQ